MLAVWMAPRTSAHGMCVWQTVHSGLLSLCHNEIRDVTADLLNEVCHNVSTEPKLQPLSGKLLSHRTANTEDEACLDVKAQGFWGDQHQCTFFDVWVFRNGRNGEGSQKE